MLFNAVTKIFYSHVTAKYHLKKDLVENKRKNKKKKVESSEDSNESSSVSEFDEDEAYDSTDSQHKLHRVKFSKMVACLDTTSMVTLSLLLLSKQFVNVKQ